MSFGNFKLNEILELIQNKDPLGLNTDIESYSTVKSNNSEVPVKMPDANKNASADADLESKMEYDAIPYYLKLAAKFNNSTDTNKENTENTSPTFQVTNPILIDQYTQ